MPLPLLPEQAAIEASFEEELTSELGSIDFAAELPENATPEQVDKAAPAFLKYMLQAGADGGFKDSISEITSEDGDPPSEANNWLFDIDEEAFKGRFVDARPEGDRGFSFVIARNGDDWDRTISNVSGMDDES